MSTIIYEKKGKIAYITLNRPNVQNALDRTTFNELSHIWPDFRDDDDVWVAIFSGRGKSFCCGRDLKDLEVGEYSNTTSAILTIKWKSQDHQLYKPLISAVQGHCLGAGVSFLVASDYVVVSEDAKIGLPEPKVNIPTPPTLLMDLPRHVAAEMLLFGEPISAQRAYEIGFVNRVVAPDQLMSSAEEAAEKLCQCGPLAVRLMKEGMCRFDDIGPKGIEALWYHARPPMMNSEDTLEAIRAFKEKRKPQWKMR